MKRILFVDDESKVLAGLRRMLRGLRREWDMEFVESGAEALHRLDQSPFDVVVTDMRMPGMDGCQLLHEVRRQHPGTVRIVLSGQCDRDSMMKAVGFTHQFLAKPCDSDLLKATVARACDLRDQIADAKTKQMVSCIQSLPTRQITCDCLDAELKSTSPSIQELGEIISCDVGLTAKVLQLVSSGFFGSPQRVTNPAHAVRLLGLETVRALVQDPEMVFALEPGSPEAQVVETLTHHSLAVAAAARKIVHAEMDDPVLVGEAALSGLLHDVGAMVFLGCEPRRCLDMLAQARQGSVGLLEAEKGMFHATRGDVGAYLLGLWGLPDTIIHVVANHLSPKLDPTPGFSALAAVHLANAFLEEHDADLIGDPSPIDLEYLEAAGLGGRLQQWRETCLAAALQGVPQ